MKSSAFAKYAWFVTGFTVMVILWGALVRATGSGAGCGNHWPTCQGEIIPPPATIETVIEYSHRISSSLDGLLAIGLVVWAWRAFPKGHRVRGGAATSLAFVIIEGLIGAMLVKYELVGENSSVWRAVVIALHLANTFILLAAMTLTAWWAGGGESLQWSSHGNTKWVLLIALLGVMLIGSSGAIVALGDTLFPANSFIEGWEQKFDPAANFLVRLRWVHPLIAVGFGLYVIVIAAYYGLGEARLKRPAQVLIALVVIQLLAGGVNVLLLAPLWMQLVHLLLADSVWIALVVFSAGLLTTRPISATEEVIVAKAITS